MDDNSRDRLTLARRFLEPANSTHRQYEALRAFFVEGVPPPKSPLDSVTRPAAFASWCMSFAINPIATSSSGSQASVDLPASRIGCATDITRLRKQNLSVHDINRRVARDGGVVESSGPSPRILKAEGCRQAAAAV